MSKNKIIKFLKIYLIFILFVLIVNLSLELIVPTPEREAFIAENGLQAFLLDKIKGVVIFYLIFNFIGSLIYHFKNFKWLKMGFLSFIFGFILEFLMMRPEWVQNIYTLKLSIEIIPTVIISAAYWFIAWGAPSFILQKFHIVKKG